MENNAILFKELVEIDIKLQSADYIFLLLKTVCRYFNFKFGVLFNKSDILNNFSAFNVDKKFEIFIKNININDLHSMLGNSPLILSKGKCANFNLEFLKNIFENHSGVNDLIYMPYCVNGVDDIIILFGIDDFKLLKSIKSQLTEEFLTLLGKCLFVLISCNEHINHFDMAIDQLKEKERIFELFMTYFPGVAFIKDSNTRCIYINRHMENVWGVKNDYVLNKTNNEIFGEDFGKIISAQDDEIIYNKDYLEVENEFTIQPGEKRVFLTRKFRISRENKKPLIGGIMLDINDRRQAEEALKKSETRYRHLIECAQEGFWGIDSFGITNFVSSRMCQILGYNSNEIIGKPPYDFTDDNNNMAFKEDIFAVGPIISERILKHKNGQNIYLKLSITTVKDDDGDSIGRFILATDLTEQKILETKVIQTRKEILEKYSYKDIVGKSRSIRSIINLLPNIAEFDCNVLIEGPTGTGKSMLARVIHNLSERSKNPFIVLNCGAIPETLFESEFFGYVKGAFTDAKNDKTGKIAAAEGGTIFLDEISEMPLNMQVKLLRLIDEKRYEPVGAAKSINANIRIIAATNKNLDEQVNLSKFRDDLYYRLKIINVKIPALNERIEDVEVLIEYFINILNKKYNKNILMVSDDARKFLMLYDFPGNIRELQNMMERAYIFCKGNVIEINDFQPEYVKKYIELSENRERLLNLYVNDTENFKNEISKMKYVSKMKCESEKLSEAKGYTEKAAIIEALNKTKNSRQEAAKILGISLPTLWRKMKKYEII